MTHFILHMEKQMQRGDYFDQQDSVLMHTRWLAVKLIISWGNVKSVILFFCLKKMEFSCHFKHNKTKPHQALE